MGNRSQLAKIREETRLGSVWRRVGGLVEQHDARRHQDFEIRHDGPEGLLGGSTNHEEVETQQVDSVVRGVHTRGADLHHHRAYETWIVVGISAR